MDSKPISGPAAAIAAIGAMGRAAIDTIGVIGVVGAAEWARREHAYTKQYGRAVGLTETAIDEVMSAWADWYQAGGELDWSLVRSAMVNRGIGIEWRPGVPRGGQRHETRG